MRTLLTTHSSTKAERKFHEILKALHIPFKSKVKIGNREVDFVIGDWAIDIDGHKQDVSKNKMLIAHGYNPAHFNNNEIPNSNLIEWLKTLQNGNNRTGGYRTSGRTASNNSESIRS